MTRHGKHTPYAARGPGWLRPALDRAAASDPGLARLHTASRTVVGLGLTLGVLSMVNTLAGQPLTVTIVGMVATMVGSIAINEPQPSERLITAAATIATNAAAASLGILLAPHLIADDALFIAIAAIGTACQARWSRAVGLTLSAFMTSFFAVFLGFEFGQAGWVILSLAIGTAVAVAMTFAMPVRRDRRRRRSIRALRARLRLLLGTVRSGLEDPETDSRYQRRLWSRADRVAETTLAIEGLLDEESERLRMAVFDLELATSNLVHAWSRAASVYTEQADADVRADNQTRRALKAAVEALDVGLGSKGMRSALPTVEELTEHVRTSGTATQLQIVAIAIADVARAATWTDDPDQAPGLTWTALDPRGSVPAIPTANASMRAADTGATALADHSAPESWLDRISFGTRRTIQVTAAMIIAVVAGELISSDRWYWALVAAFAIFGPTVSRGETLVRAWTRIVGTVVGAVAGTLLAELVGGGTFWSTVMIFVVMFFAIYTMQVSYALMMTGITMMLALLYGLLGTFSPEILGTRILLTAVGAVIGVVAALVILPIRTRDTTREQLKTYLNALDNVITSASRRVSNADDTDLTGQVRELDCALAAVRAGIRPLAGGPLMPGIRRAGTHHTLGLLRYTTHNAHGLARVAQPAPDHTAAEAITEAADHVSRHIAHLSMTLDHAPARSPSMNDPVMMLQSTIPPKQELLTVLARCLHKIDLTVGQLSADFTDRCAPAPHRIDPDKPS